MFSERRPLLQHCAGGGAGFRPSTVLSEASFFNISSESNSIVNTGSRSTRKKTNATRASQTASQSASQRQRSQTPPSIASHCQPGPATEPATEPTGRSQPDSDTEPITKPATEPATEPSETSLQANKAHALHEGKR